MKRIAIIDDESDARRSLITLLTRFCPDVEICGEADSVESAYTLIHETKPQAILLDISMEDGTGFDLLDKFSPPAFRVIFVTAHDEFALKAFRYHALDYLLKPINPHDLVQTIDLLQSELPEKYETRIRNLLQSTQAQKHDKITLTSQEGLIFLSINQIVRLQSDGGYTTFYLTDKAQHLIVRPMKEFEELLSGHDFYRTHQSHLVNLSFVQKILRVDGGRVLMEDGSSVPIARRRKDRFIELMKEKFSI